jgi:hypothetical protein
MSGSRRTSESPAPAAIRSERFLLLVGVPISRARWAQTAGFRSRRDFGVGGFTVDTNVDCAG